MVIRVEVRPSQPTRLGHSSEHGMEVPGEAAAPIGRDLPEQLFKFCDVRVEVRRSGATRVLIEVRSGKNASRPPDGCVQSDPSHHETRKRSCSELRRPFSGQQAVPVAQVAHHLVRLTCVPNGGRYPDEALADGEGPPPCHVRAPASSSCPRSGLSARGDARRQPLETRPARAGVPLRHQRAASGTPGHREAHQIAATR